MSIRATSPFPVFLDSDGTPLSQGYVYFGVSGSNPETVPQAVYWDEALTIPAAQPLRTLNGFLVRNGSPANVYTASVYSVLVRNRNRALLYSSLVGSDILTDLGFSAFVKTLIDDADAATFRQSIGTGPNALSYGSSQNPAALPCDTFWQVTAAGATTQDFTAGAARAGIRLSVYNSGAGACTVKLAVGVTTLVLSQGQHIDVQWDGSSWHKVGGSEFSVVLTAGAGATWLCPFSGTYKATVVGGGGGGGGCGNVAGQQVGAGGGAGGTAIKMFFEVAGATFTYTVGGGGAGGLSTPAAGTNGTASTLGDGTVTITGGGGSAGDYTTVGAHYGAGGAGGVASVGDVNIPGEGGDGGSAMIAAGSAMTSGGKGGASTMSGSPPGPSSNASADGASGGLYGGGGNGGINYGAVAARAGGPGAGGIIVINF